jgi:hypothetical protein
VKLALKVLRTLLSGLLLAAGWASFAWLSSGRPQAAIALALISLVIAPLLLPDLVFWNARLKKRLRPLELKEASPLRDLVLQCVLRESGLRPRFWLLESEGDQGFLWFERGFGRSRRQDIILSEAWLKGLPGAGHQKEFLALWSEIARTPPGERLLRSFQFRIWLGAFWMLDMLFDFLDFLLRSVGLREMPHPAFWCQGFAWDLKRRFFGRAGRTTFQAQFSAYALRVDREPLYWKSWVFGVWSRYPTRCLHPAWRVLSEPYALIES